MTRPTLSIWIVCVGLALGCGKSSPSASPTAGSGQAPAPAVVVLYVNDQVIARVPVSELGSWPRLETLLPPPMRRLRTWDDLVVQTRRATPWHGGRPSDTSPLLVPALFMGTDQLPAFGMFAPDELARRGKPEVRQDAVTEVRISITLDGTRPGHAADPDSGGGGGSGNGGGSGDRSARDDTAAPAALKISVKTPHGTSTLAGPALMAIPRQPAPGDVEPVGWTLTSVVKAAGIETFAKLRLTDVDGVSRVLDRADFGAASIPFVKLNRKGLLRVQVYTRKGATWERSGDLRGLVSLEQIE